MNTRYGARNGTWTRTVWTTRPSNVRVCQFRHSRITPGCCPTAWILYQFLHSLSTLFSIFLIFLKKEFLPISRETRYGIKRCAAAGAHEAERHKHSAGGIGHTRHIPQKNVVNPTENKQNKAPQPPEEVFSSNIATPGGGRSKPSIGQARLRQCFRFIHGFHTGCWAYPQYFYRCTSG